MDIKKILILMLLLVGLIYGCSVQKNNDIKNINFNSPGISGKEENITKKGMF